MVIAPPFHREPTAEDTFLVERFGADVLLDAATILDRESREGPLAERSDESNTTLIAALRILLASGFHSFGSFTRPDPTDQIRFVIPFMREHFGRPSDSPMLQAAAQECFDRVHAEYENFELVRAKKGGDAKQASQFLLELYKAGRVHWHHPRPRFVNIA